jgi:SAM-dependent methyltransferase
MFLAAGVIAYYFFGGFIWGAGYAPTSSNEIDNIAKLLDLKEGDTFYDLGCGYGRVIFAMVERYHVNSIGIEADPVKCSWIRFMTKRKKLQDRVKLIQSDIFNVDLGDARNVFIFLSKVGDIMERLKEKVLREMKPGTHIVSHVHRFDDWEPEKKLGSLYLYAIPAQKRAEVAG